MRMKVGIAIAGTHGKTTTTSLIATVLAAGGLDPTVVIGGRLNSIGSNAKLGQGEFLVAEADESDGSFVKLMPTIAVVTNIDPEHLDYYSGIDQIREAFLNFINQIPFFGLAVLCLDHPNVQSLLPRLKKRFVTYGLTTQADFQAKEISFDGLYTTFDVLQRQRELGRLKLRMPGIHNVYNALATVATAFELDIPFQVIQETLLKQGPDDRRAAGDPDVLPGLLLQAPHLRAQRPLDQRRVHPLDRLQRRRGDVLRRGVDVAGVRFIG
jgi:UDP-N-acetylmuramate--alanine ligase